MAATFARPACFLIVDVAMFSCELEGSIASLLGTGVMLEGFRLSWRELVLVDSFRQGDESGIRGEDLVAFCEALEKKPRMLCCLPVVEDAVLVFFANEGVFGLDFSPIFSRAPVPHHKSDGKQNVETLYRSSRSIEEQQ